ncbi:MAG: DUF1461 domain-containing protein [Proteobacteria bacterium]|nr:DUF1461 domain-containing protein [Pseudomonadota bacterium]
MAATVGKSLHVRRLNWVQTTRDSVLGISFGLVVLMLAALICFTRPFMDAMGLNPDITAFLWSGMSTDELRQMVFFVAPDVGMSFTPDEADHLADVRSLLHSTLLAAGALGVLLLAGSMLRPNWRRISTIAFGFLAALAASGFTVWQLSGFKTVSHLFHNVFFSGGNWQFASHQLMMKLYPPVVMQTGMTLCFIMALLVTGTFALVMATAKKKAR